MKCEIHDCEMEYVGENSFGGDIWSCPQCFDEEDYYDWHNDAYQQDHPEKFPELFEDEPPEPFWEEARLHAEAELEWAAKEAERGDGITWEQYGRLLDEATEAQLKRLKAEDGTDGKRT